MSTKNAKYSHKDFTGRKLTSRPAAEFNDSEIVGSCFYQEGQPDVEVFPAGMTGVTFRNCNLDNVLIPDGNTIEGGSHKRVIMQKDGEDWITDKNNNPLEPIAKKTYVKLGISTDPKDLPSEQQETPATLAAVIASREADIAAVKAIDSELAKRLGLEQ